MPIILDGTKGETFPSWTTGTRPATPNTGQTGYNTSLGILETYNGSVWLQNINTITPGTILQVVNYQTGALATGTTLIPVDDTIPQNTEGNQYMSLAITPKSSTSKLRIDVVFVASCSANNSYITNALFQDTTTNALAVTTTYVTVGTAPTAVPLTYYMTSGTTSETTFKVRGGGSVAASTMTFNGSGGARIFGGVFASSITITEIAA